MIERIALLRFPLIYAVVVIHATHEKMYHMETLPTYFREYISYNVASVAVPIFFVISGYLFFTNWAINLYFKKLLSRARTLLLPYLLWNFIAFSYMVAFFVSPRPETGQFWFLQELMLMVLIAPAFHVLHKKALSSLVLMLIVWLFFDWNVKDNWPVLSSMLPILFFYLGSVIAVKRQSLFMFDRYGYVLLIISLILFSVNSFLHPASQLYFKVAILCGVPGFLFLSKFLPRKPFMFLGSASFFVFAFHQPILGQMISRIFLWFDIQTDAEIMAAYFILPVITSGIGIGLYWILKRYTPGFTNLLTGGR